MNNANVRTVNLNHGFGPAPAPSCSTAPRINFKEINEATRP